MLKILLLSTTGLLFSNLAFSGQAEIVHEMGLLAIDATEIQLTSHANGNYALTEPEIKDIIQIAEKTALLGDEYLQIVKPNSNEECIAALDTIANDELADIKKHQNDTNYIKKGRMNTTIMKLQDFIAVAELNCR